MDVGEEVELRGPKICAGKTSAQPFKSIKAYFDLTTNIFLLPTTSPLRSTLLITLNHGKQWRR
jgi:hypothetical protein